MKVICSWCRGEGRDGLVGEKSPLDDLRETHSICIDHEQAVRARWASHRQTLYLYNTPANGIGGLAYRTRRVIHSAVQLCVDLKGRALRARL